VTLQNRCRQIDSFAGFMRRATITNRWQGISTTAMGQTGTAHGEQMFSAVAR
jgi:hypothetical protein